MTAFQNMKQSNCMRILRLLRERPHSRAELSRETGLTRAAITGIIDGLITDGLVIEGEITTTSKGRRPTMLHLAPNAYYTIGIDISRQGVELCFLDFNAHSVFEHRWSKDTDRETVTNEIVDTVEKASASFRFLGIGVVAPGPVDCVNGKILEPSGLEAFHGFCVSELEERLDLPTLLKKDTSALAIAEKARIGTDASFLVLLADHGLGGGYIYNGRIFERNGGFGCEIGHLSIDTKGPPCTCGNRGCAEMYASIPSALERARSELYDVDWEKLNLLAEGGNETALRILSDQADALACACVSSVNLLEPERIVLEGELCGASNLFTEKIESALRDHCFSQYGRAVRVEASGLPHNARAFSAANLILEAFFEDSDNDNFRKL